MTPEYAIISIMGVIIASTLTLVFSKNKFAGKSMELISAQTTRISVHDAKIEEQERAIQRLCDRIDEVIKQNTKVIEQNSLVIMRLRIENVDE